MWARVSLVSPAWLGLRWCQDAGAFRALRAWVVMGRRSSASRFSSRSRCSYGTQAHQGLPPLFLQLYTQPYRRSEADSDTHAAGPQ